MRRKEQRDRKREVRARKGPRVGQKTKELVIRENTHTRKQALELGSVWRCVEGKLMPKKRITCGTDSATHCGTLLRSLHITREQGLEQDGVSRCRVSVSSQTVDIDGIRESTASARTP